MSSFAMTCAVWGSVVSHDQHRPAALLRISRLAPFEKAEELTEMSDILDLGTEGGGINCRSESAMVSAVI